MKLGIVQGRLSEPVDGKIQEFPSNWEREFELLSSINLSHIEWIITNKFVHNWKSKHLKPNPGLISGLCLDTIISDSFPKQSFIEQQIKIGIDYCKLFGVNRLAIPLLEHSSVQSLSDSVFEYIVSLREKEIIFSFETDILDPNRLRKLVDRDGCYITYDMGNMTPFRIKHDEYIKTIYDKLDNLHLKDKTFDGKSVCFGCGDTEFTKTIDFLKFKKYNKYITLQFARGKTSCEVEEIKNQIDMFQRVLWRK